MKYGQDFKRHDRQSYFRGLDKMNMVKLFPTILIILDIGAAVVYLWYGDIRHTIYWLAAAVLTICVTF